MTSATSCSLRPSARRAAGHRSPGKTWGAHGRRSTLTSPINRFGAAAQNALEVARFGGLETGEEESPYEVVAERPIYRLRRYFPGEDADSPVLLVPPMMLAAEVYDVSPGSTAVGTLHAHGADPWVVDFGAPEREEAVWSET